MVRRTSVSLNVGELFHLEDFLSSQADASFSSLSASEPIFVSMAHMPESKNSKQGDDDKIYLFFSETAVECDCHNKLVVSRVARVCKVTSVTITCKHLSYAHAPLSIG